MSYAVLLVSILSLLAPQEFSRFSYCRNNSRGPFEVQCVTLDAAGRGEVRFKRRGADEISVNIQLSPGAQDRYLAIIAATDNLEQGDSYESNRRVADLGLKTLVLEMPEGRREAKFNFSTRKEVTDLVTFFDGLINQETLGFDIDTALQFERLSIPQRLDDIENELRANRISDPPRLIPVLEKIEQDERLVNFARTRAGRLKEQILSRP
jgi:hypothetical protein